MSLGFFSARITFRSRVYSVELGFTKLNWCKRPNMKAQ